MLPPIDLIKNKNNDPTWTARKNKILKNEQSFRDTWDNIKNSNVCVIGILEEEEIQIDAKRNIWISNSRKLLKCGGRHKFRDLRSSLNSRQDKIKENHVQTHHNQTIENWR